MSGKDRRDTYLTVNFPAGGYTSVGPNAYVNTVKLPMEHLQQVLQIPASDMDEQLRGVTLHDATHASPKARLPNILMQQRDGSSIEPFPDDERQFHIDSQGNVGCHHFVVSNGSFPEPTRSMGRNFINKSTNKEMQAKLKNLGVHTAAAMKDIHQVCSALRERTARVTKSQKSRSTLAIPSERSWRRPTRRSLKVLAMQTRQLANL